MDGAAITYPVLRELDPDENTEDNRCPECNERDSECTCEEDSCEPKSRK